MSEPGHPLKRILYVEDDQDIRTVACMALEAVGGYEVIACACGADAIEAAPSAHADLVLLDVMMPGLDGPATLARLRELPATAATPVIFMTAKIQASELSQYRALGVLGVIPKPFDPMQVSAEIRRIWDERPSRRAAGG